MTAEIDKMDNVYEIDHKISSDDSEIDFDLSKNMDEEDTGEIDIRLDQVMQEGPRDYDPVDDDHSLVTRPPSDVTVRVGRRHLQRMRDHQLLDAHDFQERRIVHPDMDDYRIHNAFREIRTKLLQESGGKNLVIMVVSLQHGMGTTFTSVNLAAAFSYEGEKTSLIVDCDKTKRKIEEYFPVDVDFGLTDYLDDRSIGTEKIIYQTGIARMRFVPVGRRRETIGEFFSSERMRDFILQVKKRYSDRYVILNAPPLEVSADAAILSEISDRIIVVLPYGKVSNARLAKALKLIPQEKIAGLVLNDKLQYV